MSLELLLAFIGACVLLSIKPGAAMSLIVANSVMYRTSGGLVTVAGNVLGCAMLVGIVALGLAWMAESMRSWFDWIRVIGALYLIWLGISRLRNAGRVSAPDENPTGRLFRDGFIVAISNPEVIMFLATLLPPFVDARYPAAPQLMILAAAFVGVSTLAGIILAVLAGQARVFLSGERLKWIDYVSGGLIVVAGLWLIWPKG